MWSPPICSHAVGSGRVLLRRVATLASTSSQLQLSKVEPSTDAVVLTFADGHRQTVRYQWLADSCRCERCYNAQTAQRNTGPGIEIPPADVQPESSPQLDSANGGLRLRWGKCGSGTAGESFYSGSWLGDRCNSLAADIGQTGRAAVRAGTSSTTTMKLVGPGLNHNNVDLLHGRQLWNRDTASAIEPIPFREIHAAHDRHNRGLMRWLDQIWTHGFSIVRGVPCDKQSTQAALARIGVTRNTLYGMTYEVHNRPDDALTTVGGEMNDSSYSGDALGVHTDGTYWSDPPGLQVFHCFAADTAGGGTTVLVDGLEIARILQTEAPSVWHTLSTVPIRFEFEDSQHSLIQHHTVFATDELGNPSCVRWNPHDRGAMDVECPDAQRDIYAALEVLQDLLTRPSLQHRVVLQPGDLLVLHNHRVMHGRDAFRSRSERHLFGFYVDNDELVSRLRWVRKNVR